MDAANRLSRGVTLRIAVLVSFGCWWLAWVLFRVAVPGSPSRSLDPNDPPTLAILAVIKCIPFGLLCLPVTYFWLRRWPGRRIWFVPLLGLILVGATSGVLVVVYRALSTGSMGWYGNPASDVVLWHVAAFVAYHLVCLTYAALSQTAGGDRQGRSDS